MCVVVFGVCKTVEYLEILKSSLMNARILFL